MPCTIQVCTNSHRPAFCWKWTQRSVLRLLLLLLLLLLLSEINHNINDVKHHWSWLYVLFNSKNLLNRVGKCNLIIKGRVIDFLLSDCSRPFNFLFIKFHYTCCIYYIILTSLLLFLRRISSVFSFAWCDSSLGSLLYHLFTSFRFYASFFPATIITTM